MRGTLHYVSLDITLLPTRTLYNIGDRTTFIPLSFLRPLFQDVRFPSFIHRYPNRRRTVKLVRRFVRYINPLFLYKSFYILSKVVVNNLICRVIRTFMKNMKR